MMKVDLAKLSNNFFKYGADGQRLLAWHSIGQFFEAAEGTNPCTALMHINYAHNSVLDEGLNNYYSGCIKEGKFKNIIQNSSEMTGRLLTDSRFKELIGLTKEMYPKTYKKRLSILPNLTDSEVVGMANVSNNKKGKVLHYIVKKLMFWT